MSKQAFRPYDISLWSLQDQFICTLATQDESRVGQVHSITLSISDDGTQELKFTIPMYYRRNGELMENPIWYDYYKGSLIAVLKKIKVILNKGDAKEGVYEFQITKVQQTHDKDGLNCVVECQGMAFRQLGKIGYKISLSQDGFLLQYDNWAEELANAQSEEEAQEIINKQPIATLNYWCDKVFNNLRWDYEIIMNWSDYDGTTFPENYNSLTDAQKNLLNSEREQLGLRRFDTVYEDEYASSWAVQNDSLVPTKVEKFKQKARTTFSCENSNVYNITQTLAQNFEVYCRYQYVYNQNYHIIGRKVIFYNGFIENEKGRLDISYPNMTDSISRKMDGTDLVTKMYVKPIENESVGSGYITIADCQANYSGQDYLLNFDYIYSIGGISDQQYKYIKEYEKNLFVYNQKLINASNVMIQLTNTINDNEAQAQIKLNQVTQANQQATNAENYINSMLGSDGGQVVVKENAPKSELMIPKGTDAAGNTLYSIILSEVGVVKDTIKVFKTKDNGKLSDEVSISESNYVLDDNGYVVELKNLKKSDTEFGTRYLTFTYEPLAYYKLIKNTYANIAASAQKEYDNLQAQLQEDKKILENYNNDYDTILKQKQQLIIDFEFYMGPAIKEGFWQDDKYVDYGEQCIEAIKINEPQTNKYSTFLWDEQPFENEQKGYYESGVQVAKLSYPYLDMTNYISNNQVWQVIKQHCKNDNSQKLRIFYSYTKYNIVKSQPDEHGYSYNISVPDETQQKSIIYGSQFFFGTILDNNQPKLVIYITDKQAIDSLQSNNITPSLSIAPKFGYVTVNESLESTNHIITEINNNDWIVPPSKEPQPYALKFVYPRIKIDSKELKDSTNITYMHIVNNYNNIIQLKKYQDFSLLYRDAIPYFTLKMDSLLYYLYNTKLNIYFTISNAATSLYLDAIEVLKQNSQPRVEYDINVKIAYKNIEKQAPRLNETTIFSFQLTSGQIDPAKKFLKYIYNYLDYLASIDDYQLKFKDAKGYISKIQMDLQLPQNDKITIENYKTKFQDLFSSIVASTESLKANSARYNNAASAFSPNGQIKGQAINGIQQLNFADLYNIGGNLTVGSEIIASNKKGAVVMSGGGIFTSNQKDIYGNYIWNTAISPDGINANLITSGQLDTNLIRIFAGDNVAFQMNALGLFAYKFDQNGNYINSYVVHNGDGLFLTDWHYDGSIDRVQISWDGLIIRNADGQKVFYADNDGNLTLVGNIEANTGSIGGWSILPNSLQNSGTIGGAEYNIGIATPIHGDDKVFWAGETKQEPNFYVTKDGFLRAENAYIAGQITSNSTINGVIAQDLTNALDTISLFSYSGDIFQYAYDESTSSYSPRNDNLRYRVLTNIAQIASPENLRLFCWFQPKNQSDIFLYDTGETEQVITPQYDEEGNITGYETQIVPIIREYNQQNPKPLAITIDRDYMFSIPANIAQPQGQQYSSRTCHIVISASSINGEYVPGGYQTQVAINNLYDGQSQAALVNLVPEYGTVFHRAAQDIYYSPEGLIFNVQLIGPILMPTEEQDRKACWTVTQDGVSLIDNESISFLNDYTMLKVQNNIANSITNTSPIIVKFAVGKFNSTVSIILVNDGKDGETPIEVRVFSTSGNMFVNNNISATLIASVYQANQDVTDQYNENLFSWKKYDTNGVQDEDWSYAHRNYGRTLTINSDDINTRATFLCELSLEEEI